jgi:hypothetical protein
MKKKYLLLFFVPIFFACKSKEIVPDTPAPENPLDKNVIITFEKNINPLLKTTCSPCHFPGGGRANTWDNYTKTKNLITGIIERVEKDPTNNGFMPKGGSPLTVSQIAILKKWIDDGLLEK